MKTIIFGVLLFILWGGFYTLITILKEDVAILFSFGIASAVTMVLTAIVMVERGK